MSNNRYLFNVGDKVKIVRDHQFLPLWILRGCVGKIMVVAERTKGQLGNSYALATNTDSVAWIYESQLDAVGGKGK